jgi:competence protein ComEC
MVQHGENRFLFTGDMEELAEHELVEAGVDLKADVLKAGHHGSYSSSSYRFLREVAPTYSVISCGAANDYGHPHEVTLSRLEDADTIIFRTDRMYTVVAESDGTQINMTWGNTFAQPGSPEFKMPAAA